MNPDRDATPATEAWRRVAADRDSPILLRLSQRLTPELDVLMCWRALATQSRWDRLGRRRTMGSARARA